MSPREERLVAAGDVSLWVESVGEGCPVVLLHGFTGSAQSMASTAAALGDGYETHCVELVGHGRSDAPEALCHYEMASCVSQLLAVFDALELACPHVIGYSMGGRAALSLGVAQPQRVASCLLVGASPGIDDACQRAARVRADEALAARILSDGIESFVERWMAQPLFASQRRLGREALARARAQRLLNRPHALAASLRGMGTGAMPPLHDALSKLVTPVCLVVGEEDAKFEAIARDIGQRLPNGRVECLEQAGHAAHLESPHEFARLARRFFAAVAAQADSNAPRGAHSSDSTTPQARPGASRVERFP